MNWIEIIKEILLKSFSKREELGERGKQEVEKTNTGDRQNRAEKEIYQTVKETLDKMDLGVRLEAEEHVPFDVKWPDFFIRLDPLDGTWAYERALRKTSEPIATVISVVPIMQDPLFKDIIAGGIIDLRSQEWWVAQKNKGAFKGLGFMQESRFKTKDQTHLNMPAMSCDFYRRVNGITRFLYPKCLEIWNGLSSLNMLLVALGEVDLYFNGLPQLSPEGQKGHELGAAYIILKEAGNGYAMDMRTGQELGESPYLFNEQTPVIIGINQPIVEEFWNTVKNNFQKNEKILRQLWDNIPREK